MWESGHTEKSPNSRVASGRLIPKTFVWIAPKCKITNRITVGFPTPEFATEKLGFGDENNLLLGNFTQVSKSISEERIPVIGVAGGEPEQPETLEQFRRCVGGRINSRRLFTGEQYRGEREVRLKNLSELDGDTPGLFSLDFLIIAWESFGYDYVDRSFDGVRRLVQFCRHSGDIAEIRRLALAKHLPDVLSGNPFVFQHVIF